MVDQQPPGPSQLRGAAARRWTGVLVFLAALGLLLRVVISSFTIGSNDAAHWLSFARHLTEHGLAATYREVALFNHPPLMAGLSVASLGLAGALGARFEVIFKLPGILGEGLVLYLLWRTLRPRGHLGAAAVSAAYSLNPASLLISGYHGNTDCLCAALILLAVVLARERMPALGVGLALAAAINVKLIAVLLIPALAVYCRTAPRGVANYLGGLALGALPFVAVVPEFGAFYSNAIAYNSMVAPWGMGLFYLRTLHTLPWAHSFLAEAVLPAGRYLVISCALATAAYQLYRPRWSPGQAAALCMSGFLVFAPGFGIQYIVYPLPVMFMVSFGWGVGYALLSGAFAAVAYITNWTRTWPAFSDFAHAYQMPSELFGLLAWTTLVSFSVRLLRTPGAMASQRRPAIEHPV